MWPQQLAVGVKGSAPLLVHWARTLLELHPTWALIRIDFVNAFQTVSKAAALEAVRSDPDLRHWYPSFYAWISKSADVRVGWAELCDWASDEGVQQGDGLAMAAFCLALQPLLVACDQALGEFGELRAFADDVFVCCDPTSARAAAAVRTLTEDAEVKRGLRWSEEKTRCFL